MTDIGYGGSLDDNVEEYIFLDVQTAFYLGYFAGYGVKLQTITLRNG